MGSVNGQAAGTNLYLDTAVNASLGGPGSSVFNGTISGAGGITKSGTGNVTLSGANTYSGGTTVSSGSLIGTTTSLQRNIVDNANVTFNQATNGTYAGVLMAPVT